MDQRHASIIEAIYRRHFEVAPVFRPVRGPEIWCTFWCTQGSRFGLFSSKSSDGDYKGNSYLDSEALRSTLPAEGKLKTEILVPMRSAFAKRVVRGGILVTAFILSTICRASERTIPVCRRPCPLKRLCLGELGNNLPGPPRPL